MLVAFLIIVLFVVVYYLFDTREHFTIYAIPDKYKIRRDKCLEYCDEKNCLSMFQRQSDLDKCRECNLKGGCFRKSIIGGVCEVCEEGGDYVDCDLTRNFGCKNPKNILDFTGVDPYYVIVEDDDSFSYSNSCKFCWNI